MNETIALQMRNQRDVKTKDEERVEQDWRYVVKIADVRVEFRDGLIKMLSD